MQTREILTQAVEDYLKSIYEITQCDERASTNRIAERMHVTPASVTGMLRRMAASDPPLLLYHKHRGVELTPEGEKAALEVIRHHRLLELFLHETLGYAWDEVHEEADRLEHVISEDFEERIAQVLGNPQHDPHGDPIPTRDLQLPTETAIPLYEMRPGQRGTVHRVGSEDRELLRHLQSIGLLPQASLTVLDYSAFDGNLRFQIGDQVSILGPKITRQIFVEVSEE
jgi:DtxR family Mn-dependent transcriptional regulator